MRNNRKPLAIFVLYFVAITDRAVADISITISPLTVQEFSNSYTIRCQYPAPAANSSTKGILRITHLPSEVIYTYDFDASEEIISSAMKIRSSATLNQTINLLVFQVNVALAADAGSYNCSLVDSTHSSEYYATSADDLHVTGCVNGTRVSSLTGCPSMQLGNPCSIVCSSSDPDAVVSISSNYDGSNPVTFNMSEVNYTIQSLNESDFKKYYCYVRSTDCTSMAETAITPLSMTTTPASGNNCNNGCRKRIPGWGIALIVIACVIVLAIIMAILFVLFKKGKFSKKEGGVQPETGGGHNRSVANDNFAMTKSGKRSNESEDKNRNGKKDSNGKASNGDNSGQVVNFPDVKTRKNQLPPLNRSSIQDDSPDIPIGGRALPKRKKSIDDNHSPDGRRRSSLTRRHSPDAGGSPDRSNRLPPIRSSDKDYDEEHDRF